MSIFYSYQENLMSYYMTSTWSNGSRYMWAVITDATQWLDLCRLSEQQERCGLSSRELSFWQEGVRKVLRGEPLAL